MLIHLYSDTNYSLNGTTAIYRIQNCSNDCSGHGVCENYQCLCDHGYIGESCEWQSCPLECGYSQNRGDCDFMSIVSSCRSGQLAWETQQGNADRTLTRCWPDTNQMLSRHWLDADRTLTGHWLTLDTDWTLTGRWLDADWTLTGCWPDADRMLTGRWPDAERTLTGHWPDTDRTRRCLPWFSLCKRVVQCWFSWNHSLTSLATVICLKRFLSGPCTCTSLSHGVTANRKQQVWSSSSDVYVVAVHGIYIYPPSH